MHSPTQSRNAAPLFHAVIWAATILGLLHCERGVYFQVRNTPAPQANHEGRRNPSHELGITNLPQRNRG